MSGVAEAVGADHVAGPSLSAGAAARRLGVAVATLRSWDRRYGLGPSEHVPGTHRRFSPGDIDRLESACRLVGEGVPIAEAARVVSTEQPKRTEPAAIRSGGGHTLPTGRRAAASARGLARCAIRLDTSAVLTMLEADLARNGVLATWQDTIQPALAAVGRKWTETDGRYVEVEHLLSWCVTVALHRTTAITPPGRRTRRGVLLACAADEWHSLPLEVLAAALAERGVPTRTLGPAVPGRALIEAARRTGPAAAVVWSQAQRTADVSVLRGLAAVPGIRIYAAGPGWSGRQPSGVDALVSLPGALAALTESD